MATQRATVRRVTRAVIASQMLFSTGHSLTTGGFFTYFIYEFQPTALMLSLLQIAPETSEAFSVWGRWIAIRFGNRKWIWITALTLARVAALCIPVTLLWAGEGPQSGILAAILLLTIVWYLCQGIAYVNYVSWLSDLVPEVNWGAFFAKRQMAIVAISISVPIAAGLIRQDVLKSLPESDQRWSYAAIFLVGGTLCLGSIGPMLPIPHVPWQHRNAPSEKPRRRLRFSRHYGLFLMSRWWLAFFQGLTQAALFKFSVDFLNVDLVRYYTLSAVMLLLQFPCAWIGGRLSDQSRDRPAFALGILATGLGLGFLFLADREHWWWIFGTYAFWGGFGLVNVCGNNLCLKLSPSGDNAAHIGLYRQVSGLFAGASGMLGGWWLDRMLSAGAEGFPLTPYYVLFAISMGGRLTAPLWLLGVAQPISQGAESGISGLAGAETESVSSR